MWIGTSITVSLHRLNGGSVYVGAGRAVHWLRHATRAGPCIAASHPLAGNVRPARGAAQLARRPSRGLLPCLLRCSHALPSPPAHLLPHQPPSRSASLSHAVPYPLVEAQCGDLITFRWDGRRPQVGGTVAGGLTLHAHAARASRLSAAPDLHECMHSPALPTPAVLPTCTPSLHAVPPPASPPQTVAVIEAADGSAALANCRDAAPRTEPVPVGEYTEVSECLRPEGCVQEPLPKGGRSLAFTLLGPCFTAGGCFA